MINAWQTNLSLRNLSGYYSEYVFVCCLHVFFFFSYLQLSLSPPPAHYIIRHQSVFHLHSVIFLAEFLTEAYQNILNWLCLCAFCILRPVAEALKASLLAIEKKKQAENEQLR